MSLSMQSRTVVTHRNWFERMASSVCGLCCGVLLIPVAMVLLSVNEHTARTQHLMLEDARSLVVEAPQSKAELSSSTLYYVSGPLDTAKCVLQDPELGITVRGALRLERKAEQFQIREHKHTTTEKTAGGGETTYETYTYSEDWSGELVDSSRFHDRSLASSNLRDWRYGGPFSTLCESVTLSDTFKLGSAATEELLRRSGDSSKKPVSVADPAISAIARRELGEPEETHRKGKRGSKELQKAGRKELASLPARIHGNYVYFALQSRDDDGDRSPAISPKVGDERYSFSASVVQEASFIGAVEPSTGLIKPFKVKTGAGRGKSLLLASAGTRDADDLLDDAQTDNTVQMWLLRLLGWVLFFAAFSLFFQPLVIAPQLVPFLGGFVSAVIGFGAGLVSFVLATVLAVVVIAVAWIAVRPALSISLIVGAAGFALFFFGRSWSKKKAEGAAAVAARVAATAAGERKED